MRIAAMILGLLLSAWCFFEAFAISLLEANSVLASEDEAMAGAAGAGLLAALVGVVAAALVIAFPLASTVFFALSGIFSFAAASSGYENHWLYGPVFLGLSVMAFLGWRGKKKERQERLDELQRQRDRDDRMETLMRQQAQSQSPQHPQTR